MNSKAIRKQLLAAVAMVLVAAVALGSSTYAWFVASGTVEATGMKVQAQSEGGLVISYGGTAWGTSASANMTTTQKLLPTSTTDLAEWVHASAKAANNFAAEAGAYEDVSTQIFRSGDGTLENRFQSSNNFVVFKKFLVRSSSKDAASLSSGLFVSDIKVTIADSTAAVKRMSTAMRVGVQCGDNKYIFGPVSVSTESGTTNATNNYKVYKGNGTEKAVVTLATLGTSSALIPFNTNITNEQAGVPVYIYIWFEGEDASLFSDNYEVEDLNVSVNLQSYSSVQDLGKVNLQGATVSATNPVMINTTPYYKISVKGYGADLYTTDTSLSSNSKVYTISGSGETATANDVTTQFKLPGA